MLFTTVDVETTGLDAYSCDIIQCAYAVTTETGRVVSAEVLNFYYPGVERSWSDDAFRVHGIPLESLRQYANDFETNCKKLWIMLAKSNCVSFNGDRFDIPFIQRWLKRMGFPIPEPYMSFDVMKIYRQHGIKDKLVNMPDRIGLNRSIIETLTERTFGNAGRSHLAYYDIMATNLLFNYAIQHKWVNLNPVTGQQIAEDYKDRQLDEVSGKTLYSQTKYYLRDTDGIVYEVALCPDASKYTYYMQTVTDKEAQFIECEHVPGVYRCGMICIRVTPETITLEPYKEG